MAVVPMLLPCYLRVFPLGDVMSRRKWAALNGVLMVMGGVGLVLGVTYLSEILCDALGT